MPTALRRVATMWLLAALVLPSTAGALTLWDEAVDGDLSGDRLAPTSLALSAGTNSLSVSTIAGDLEYVTLEIPSGLTLDAIFLTSFVSFDNIAFIAVQSGTQFTEPPVGTDPANILGMAHFGPGSSAPVGTDVLDDMGVGLGLAMGFAPPLVSGSYTYWIQQTSPVPVDFSMDFIVTPEPTTAILLGAGLLALAISRGRTGPG